MKAAFFHGFESNGVSSEKLTILNKYFDEVYAPTINYRNPNVFKDTLRYIKDNPQDLLIGSSMGGWLAYCISSITGTPMLLFNPAVHGRPAEISVEQGNKKPQCTIILGRQDTVINPHRTIQWLKDNNVDADIKLVNMHHRIDNDVLDASISYVI